MKRYEHSYHFAESIKIFPPRIFEENGRDASHPT
jgi:hypothetical protein